MKFNIGDRVKIISDKKELLNCSIYDDVQNQKGEIISIERKQKLPYEVQLSDTTFYFREKDLELISKKIKRRLVFLRKGFYDFPLKEQTSKLFWLDTLIQSKGYKDMVKFIKNIENEPFFCNLFSDKEEIIFLTTIPTFLNEKIWWNENDKKWEIYFVDNAHNLKNIQSYCNIPLKKIHLIEKMYLNNVFGE